MANTNIPQSIFPDLPRETPAVDDKGNFTFLWSLGFASLFQALQQNFKNEGILFPRLTASQIADIEAIYTPFIGMPLPQDIPDNPNPQFIPDISGQTVFDTTNRVSKQFVITYDGATPPNILSAQWVLLSYLVLSTTNPNGSQAGQIGWLCYYTVGMQLYICTTSGSTTSAVWTLI